MKQKVVKLEISKFVAIVIAVVVVAFAAGFFVQSSYFQGMLSPDSRDMIQSDAEKQLLSDEKMVLPEAEKQLLSDEKKLQYGGPEVEHFTKETGTLVDWLKFQTALKKLDAVDIKVFREALTPWRTALDKTTEALKSEISKRDQEDMIKMMTSMFEKGDSQKVADELLNYHSALKAGLEKELSGEKLRKYFDKETGKFMDSLRGYKL